MMQTRETDKIRGQMAVLERRVQVRVLQPINHNFFLFPLTLNCLI